MVWLVQNDFAYTAIQQQNTAVGFYVSTDGNDLNPGTYSKPFLTVSKAVSVAQPGDTVWVRGGTYSCTAQITISSNGIDTLARSCLFAYPGERPLLDFSLMGKPRVSGSADGIRLTGKYWYIKGFDIKGAQHNGIALNGGSYNSIENCSVFENRNTGLQLGNGASYNRIINCDSYFNRDSTSSTNYDGNADGFSPKLDNGTLNYFYGCRAWQNSDDGWDGYVRPSTPVAGKDTMKTVIENCWCFSNGYLKSGFAGTGNGNGFKMGGGDKVNGISNGDSLRHTMTVINCLSFNNLVKGFDQNNNRGSMTLINCTGYANGTYNFSVPGFIRVGETLTIINCISFASSGVTLAGVPNPVLETNSWMAPFAPVTASDFISIDTTGVRGPRKPDGSLPDIYFMHLQPGSGLVNHGTDVGLPYLGPAPDLGCFESNMVVGAGFIAVPNVFDFGLVSAGQHKQDSLTVINNGTLPLMIDSVFSTTLAFTITPAKATIGTEGENKFYITFTPSAAGVQKGKIVFFHNGMSSPDTVTVSGCGTLESAPLISLAPPTLNFGSIPIGTVKKDSIGVSNSGTAILQITAISSTNACFSFAPATMTIVASGTAYLAITFTPQDTLNQFGGIILSHNAVDSVDTIAVRGKGNIAVGVDGLPLIPYEFVLKQNYPNPFNPSTIIQFSVAKEGSTKLKVLNILGQEIAVLFFGNAVPGKMYSAQFNALSYSTGIYIIALDSSGERKIKKMVLMK